MKKMAYDERCFMEGFWWGIALSVAIGILVGIIGWGIAAW